MIANKRREQNMKISYEIQTATSTIKTSDQQLAFWYRDNGAIIETVVEVE
jgi:hypothetical protein